MTAVLRQYFFNLVFTVMCMQGYDLHNLFLLTYEGINSTGSNDNHIIINNNNNNLFLIRRKITSEYDQMRLTTITTRNNYNKVYLRVPNIYSLKFINLTITGKSLPKSVSRYCSLKNQKVIDAFVCLGVLSQRV